MGCSAEETKEIQTKKDTIEYEPYQKSDPKNLDIILYSLDWKTRPEICIFQKLSEKTLDKEESCNIDELIDFAQFEELPNIDSLANEGYIIFYVYIDEGVVITRNMDKINYLLGIKINEVIKICIVDISSVIISESEYFSIYEVKNQTKYFFDLTNKEISFTERNKKVNYGKDEVLSDTEIDLRDEELEEQKEKDKYIQVVNPSILLGEKNEGEEEQINEVNEENNGENNNNINNNENNNNNNNENINNNNNNTVEKEIELNIDNNTKENTEAKNFITTKMEEMENISGEENEEEEEPYEIISDTLIISGNEISKETLKELEKNFFITGLEDTPPVTSIGYWEMENNKKSKKKRRREVTEELMNRNQNEEEEDYNDYILINRNDGIPYEKKACLSNIKKIVFKKCGFSNNTSNINLKQLIIMLTKYKFLKLSINKNNISSDFSGWKYFRQILKENFSLRWVSFKDAGFNDKIFEQIISGMTLKRIRYLNISRNNITNKGMYFLNKFLMKNQTLLILDMSNNRNVTTEGIKLIGNALKMHPNISKIILSNNNLNGAGKYIGSLIKDNRSLKSLLVRNVSFELKDIEFICEDMCKKNCTIKHLDIGQNSDIGDKGLIEVGKIIDNNKSLESIGLDGLNLTMNNYFPVFQAIFKNKNIEKYSLNNNEGLPLKGILNFFLKNPNVKELSISPWDVDKDKDKVFNEEQLIQIERFHLKSPNVIIHGVKFSDNEV